MNGTIPFDSNDNAPALQVGLLGCGTVGSSVARALLEEAEALAIAAGTRLELSRIAVRHPDKKRTVRLPREIITTDALGVAIDPEIDIVVEVMGGIEPAFSCIRSALSDKKNVVTANKELLAGPGASVLDHPHVDLHFEGSVCGAIPIVRALRDSCAGDEVEEIAGIFNGTSNFVLTRMAHQGCSLDQALHEAIQFGYAEADPKNDVEGFDAAAKLVILANLAFRTSVRLQDVKRQGILGIQPTQIQKARSEGRVLRLIARARRTNEGIDLRVGPEFVSVDDPLATVDGVSNAVLVRARKAGTLSFYGSGAGGDVTAAAILGDLVTCARGRSGYYLPTIVSSPGEHQIS